MTGAYERIEHANLAIRVSGRDLPDLFANAAHALFILLAEPPDASEHFHTVHIESIDLDGLLVDWLNQLLFLHEVHHEAYTCFDIQAFSSTELRAMVWGGPTPRKLRAIKAATFEDLLVAETSDGAMAQIVFDAA